MKAPAIPSEWSTLFVAVIPVAPQGRQVQPPCCRGTLSRRDLFGRLEMQANFLTVCDCRVCRNDERPDEGRRLNGTWVTDGHVSGPVRASSGVHFALKRGRDAGGVCPCPSASRQAREPPSRQPSLPSCTCALLRATSNGTGPVAGQTVLPQQRQGLPRSMRPGVLAPRSGGFHCAPRCGVRRPPCLFRRPRARRRSECAQEGSMAPGNVAFGDACAAEAAA